MTETPQQRSGLLVVGVNHRSATAALRERLILDEAGQVELLDALRQAGVAEALGLFTCDRAEIVAVAADSDGAASLIAEGLARRGRVATAEFAAQAYRLTDDAALRHLFAVAASLDSVVLGEPQVLGQVKEAHQLAAGRGMVGSQLESTLRAAYEAAKRVRSETGIAERPTSMAAAAIQLARRVHGDLAACRAVLVGGGEMGELMAQQLREAGLSQIVVLHRSMARGGIVAHRLGGHVRPFDSLNDSLVEADILIAALGDERTAIDADAVRAALAGRRQRPMICIDSAVPGDVDRAVDRLDGAFLFDLGDLERLATAGRQSREAAAAQAWTIVDEEVARFRRSQATRLAVPAVQALRRHFEAIRADVLAESAGSDAAAVTRLLINRLLHAPSAALRELAGKATVDEPADLVAIERSLVRLFGLADAARPVERDESHGNTENGA